tara:strand:- start:327 stop:458 length:132 start_codon:yes stop_codon:yes gene_type:complete
MCSGDAILMETEQAQPLYRSHVLKQAWHKQLNKDGVDSTQLTG